MKKRFLISSLAILLVFAHLGCNKEEKLRIIYPINGAYGQNVLDLADSSTLINGNAYSLCAELGQKAELKVVFTNLSGPSSGVPEAIWGYSSESGWMVGNYGGTQQFEANDRNIDLYLTFINGPGCCRVDYYENSSSVTDSKIFTW